MTKVEIFRKNKRVVLYRAAGHAEYADFGEDIVCAALSMAMQLPLGGMQGILKVMPLFDMNSDGFLEVDMREMDYRGKEKEIDTLLESMVLMIRELSKEYPKHIKLVEKEDI
ncbi:hypothetical protein PM10SUCC1_16200 [Propionigenium maris DSM 9537]|jgi:hypothetical protein|uniref:Ribosomal processing cysteine protease Prp n=1 Tax=Propionigenium maris DSM 9537 TaxID=1123000 RepID=A0A9W6GLV3_9FUSO|nr:ribosomal-processing cysteine protease Prp [Propionigenium maris]GLI56106.1 hypothetical protein PM10SUCC1_16200 [Propionigenium maris DSM 9537]